ncbi:TPA: hypothetical protein ACH3X1_016178 [Trebouxia sp. C0004]
MQHDAAPVQPQQVVADESDSQSADSRPSRVKAKRGVFKACLQSKSLAQRPGEGAPDQEWINSRQSNNRLHSVNEAAY